MQEWYEFAEKNGFSVIDSGKCQLCNSDVGRGICECIEIANQITHKIDHIKGIENMTIFLSVDAHALQHSEIHGRWNNHFHLTRLNLIINRKIKWNYKLSPKLSEVLNLYKKAHNEEVIVNPIIGNRGNLTVKDINEIDSEKEYIKMVWIWANEVLNSFNDMQHILDEISDSFLEKVFP